MRIRELSNKMVMIREDGPGLKGNATLLGGGEECVLKEGQLGSCVKEMCAFVGASGNDERSGFVEEAGGRVRP
jgi:hypothetical protein